MELDFLERDLSKVANKLNKAFKPGDIVGFSGQLAAGKTTLIAEITKSFGYSGRVSSPTFVIEHRYPVADKKVREIIHLDLYRLNEEDLSSIDWGEYSHHPDTLVFIEWPERLLPGLVEINKKVNIEIVNDKKRHLTLQNNPSA